MIEVFAKDVLATPESFSATGDVVILYDGTMIKSDRANYDKNSSLLTLEGDVEMIGLDDKRVATNRLIINTQNKAVEFKKLFLTGDDDLWIESLGALKERNDYKLFNTRISSCNSANPDWTISFKEAHYRDDKKFITMEDATLQFYDTTVFYFPYLAFPTISERKTGLLIPQFNLSDTDGFVYEQPIFYLSSEEWDMEFNPQIRTKRGAGLHVTTRFVDSNHSEGVVRAGLFRNSMDYVRHQKMNQDHWGVELFYNSTDFLQDEDLKARGYRSGLYFNGTHLNDREYLNLQKESASSLISSNLIESRLNAFVYNEKEYFALYGRYYIDTSRANNRETLQEFPSLHYHHHMSKLPIDKLFYTVDAKLQNYTRVDGSRAYQTQIDLPVAYYNTFFNDYLDVSISENIYLSQVDFRNLTEDKGDYYYYRNYHTIELSSDLTKKYTDSIHTLHPSVTYIRPSIERESTPKYRDLNEEQRELFVTQTQEEQLSFGLNQYYYSNNLDMNLFHRFGYSSYPQRVESKGDFQNEMGYEKSGLGVYSNLIYAWNEKQIRSLTSSLRYNQSNYDIMLTHFYNHDFLLNNQRTDFINSEFRHHYNEKNYWFARFDYDIEQNFNHQWELGWAHKQKCWSAKVSVGQEIIPNVDNSFRNTSLYLELNLNPLGGIQQNIEENFSSQGKK